VPAPPAPREAIHPTAVIHPTVHLPDGMEIGPYTVIGPAVTFDGPSRLYERVSIHGKTRIGPGCVFFPGAAVGIIPQDLKFNGEQTELQIGERNIFREYVTVHLGTAPGGGITVIGNQNLFMAYVHIAHDCHIGDNTVLANNVGLSGHVEIGDWAILGGMTGVIQFARIGKHAHVGGQLRITKDVVPYCRVAGEDKVHIIGVNSIGLQRRGYESSSIEPIKAAVMKLVSPKLTTAKAVDAMRTAGAHTPREVMEIIQFVETSKLGIHK